MSLFYKDFLSPVGELRLVAKDSGLVAILWEEDEPERVPLVKQIKNEDHELLLETERQLTEYFAGRLHAFSLPIHLRGTPFQLSVWGALQKIPFGETLTYGDVANQLGKPSASRAVGGRQQS